MTSQRVPGGVVHKLPADLRKALIANGTALAAWKDITPLARNEFICWVEDAKQEVTRKRRIRRTQEELEEGQRRPCCWPGCKHREPAVTGDDVVDAVDVDCIDSVADESVLPRQQLGDEGFQELCGADVSCRPDHKLGQPGGDVVVELAVQRRPIVGHQL